VLRVAVDASYANLVGHVEGMGRSGSVLRWRWRVDALSGRTDLTRKDGDDVPARLCVLFDLPLTRLRFGDRLAVMMGRTIFNRDLPAASICYVWDAHIEPGTWLANAYTDRVMMLVLHRGAGGWFDERRDLRADFARAFPAEAASGPMPDIGAIAISGDGDNTGAQSLAFFGDIVLGAGEPQ
jgi:hypothetical protein